MYRETYSMKDAIESKHTRTGSRGKGRDVDGQNTFTTS